MTWPAGTRAPVAVVFDCDGTLVDTETVTRVAMEASLADVGVELGDAVFARMVGHPWPRTRRLMQTELGMDDDAVAVYRQAMAGRMPRLLDDPALVFPDVVATLDVLDAAGVPVAVCTSSGREHLERVLALPGLVGRFAVRVAREDTARHKPDPLPYTTTLERLEQAVGRRLSAAAATVVEDSAPGVAAGVAAGCRTVALQRGPAIHDLAAADLVVGTLTPAVLAHADAHPGAHLGARTDGAGGTARGDGT